MSTAKTLIFRIDVAKSASIVKLGHSATIKAGLGEFPQRSAWLINRLLAGRPTCLVWKKYKK